MDVETFRHQARRWVEGNLQRRDPNADFMPVYLQGMAQMTLEHLTTQRALQRRIHDAGFAGISFPVEYGGRGLSAAHERAFNEEAAPYKTPDFGVATGVTFGVCALTMLAHGTPELLRRHIPKILTGDALWAQFFSEPEAGSDLAGIRTRATRDADRWILNGAKVWSSGAAVADYGLCLARTNWDVPKHKGLTWFVVATNSPGLTIEPITQISGSTEFCQEFLDDVVVSDHDVLGEVDQGWAVAQTMLVFERGYGHDMVTSAPDRALVPDLVTLARRVGRERDPVVRQMIARAHINDYALDQLGVRIMARMSASNGLDAGIAAYGKLGAGVILPLRTRIGMEIGGPQAVAWSPRKPEQSTPSRNYLNGRRMSIAGGTNEIQRNAIGERVLGLPREPTFDSTKPFNEVLKAARGWSGKVG